MVEPSLESITLAEKVRDLTQSSGAAFAGAVLNKITSDAQKQKIVQRLDDHAIQVIGAVGYQEAIQAAGLDGKPVSATPASAALDDLADVLLSGTVESKEGRD